VGFKMKSRTWVIRPSVLAGILIGLFVYTVVVEMLGFEPFGPALPDAGILRRRLFDRQVLWLVACCAVGWVGFCRKRRPPRTAVAWPLVIVPLALAVCAAVEEAWELHGRSLEFAKLRVPQPFWVNVISSIGVAIPLALGAMFSITLMAQAHAWRQTTTRAACPWCNYDLTGNLSGRCPECGTKLVNDPDIPRQFFAPQYRWLPELSLFPDAKVRYEAYRQAWREYWRSRWAWLSLLPILALGFVVFSAERNPYWYAGIGPCLCLSLADALKGRSLVRRSLRKQLRADEQNF
jgi:hypothetical protein